MNSFSIVDTFVKTAISYTPVLSVMEGFEPRTFAWLGESYTTVPPLVANKLNLNPKMRGWKTFKLHIQMTDDNIWIRVKTRLNQFFKMPGKYLKKVLLNILKSLYSFWMHCAWLQCDKVT